MSYEIVLTGGLGFIGLNCLRYWIGHSFADRFAVIDDFSVGNLGDLTEMLAELGELEVESNGAQTRYVLHLHNAPSPSSPENVCVNVYRHDVAQREGIDLMLAGAGAVVHLAGQTGVVPSMANPTRDMESNVRGSVNLLEACRQKGIARFIFSSSSAPLGACAPPVCEESLPHPLSPYGASKLAVEGYCSAYYASFGIQTIALRFSNVYGPRSGNKGSVVAAFMRNVLAGRPLVVYGSGNQSRDFLFVEDICKAITAAIETNNHEIFGTPIHIATGMETTVNSLIGKIEKLARGSGFDPLTVNHEPVRAGEMERSFANIDKARRTLGYVPAWDLDRGLAATWNWYLEQKEKRCAF
jgi:UDP-glucose 4-epimerase